MKTEECVLLQLYGREHENDRPVNEILSEGMVIVVKEPYFKVNSEGGYGMRVDHVSDILWLSETDGRDPAKFGPAILESARQHWSEKKRGMWR
jgi:chemotaxis signal transduction protein